MKNILLAIMILSTLFLYAADFKLPDETIVGAVHSYSDSLVVHKSLKDMYLFKNDDLIKYQVYLPQNRVTKHNSSSLKNGVVTVFTGNHTKNDFNLIYLDKEKPYLNINTEAHYYKLSDNWSSFDSKINWKSPSFTIMKIKPEISWQHNVFNSPNSHSKADYISVESGFKTDEWLKYITDPYVFMALNNISQVKRDSSNAESNCTNFDVLLGFDFYTDYLPSYHNFKIGALKNHALYESNSSLDYDIPYIDKYSLYMSFNRNFIMSLYLEKQIPINDNYTVMIKNEPYTTNYSSFQQYETNYLSDVRDLKYEIQVPINTSVAMSSYYYLPYTISYQYEWRKNQPIYVYSDSLLYDINYQNSSMNRLNASTFYKINNFKINYDLTLMRSTVINHAAKQIPYLPHLTNGLSVSYKYLNLQNKTELIIEALRKDSINKEMKNNYLINNYFEYNWKYDLNFYLNINNILNQQNKKYSYYPKQGIAAQFGVYYAF
ncbi:MAG TPA: hypothetical protein PL063_07215 [Candidatus Cloacimonadota bacterium]|mgnify:CR=1 FL=1|nr:hypothetical protein [Candidatus Cloacimonadota bacterium]HQB41089.1 hypothetical protein [Candidatus Cloacimonadota bacterium]